MEKYITVKIDSPVTIHIYQSPSIEELKAVASTESKCPLKALIKDIASELVTEALNEA